MLGLELGVEGLERFRNKNIWGEEISEALDVPLERRAELTLVAVHDLVHDVLGGVHVAVVGREAPFLDAPSDL